MADDLIIRFGADDSELQDAIERADDALADFQGSFAQLAGAASQSGQEVGKAVSGMGDDSQETQSAEGDDAARKPSQQQQWRSDLALQQAALAQQHAADQNFKQQALELDQKFWAEKANQAKDGSVEQLAAQKAEADVEIRLDEEKAAAAKKSSEMAAKESAQAWNSAFAPMSSAMDGMVSGVMQGTQTMQQAMAKAGTNMAISYATSLAKMAANLAAYEVTSALGWNSMANAAASSMNKELADYLGIKAKEQTADTTSEMKRTAATDAGNATRTASDAASQSTFLGRMATQAAQWLGLESKKTATTVEQNTTRTATVEGAEGAQTAAVATADAAQTAAGTSAAVAQKATQSESILDHAGSVAAAVYDDVAQIPYVGWILAPPAAAVAFGAVAAYAEGGWGEVPVDGAPAVLHKKEMVLPANLATPLRAMLTAGPSYGLPPEIANGPAQLDAAAKAAVGGTVNNSSSGGDTHHYAPQTTIHMGSASSKLSADEVGTAVASALRTGHTQLIKQLKAMKS